MAADTLARGLAAKAFATARSRSLSVEEMGATGQGNDQPAVQRAVRTAILHGIPKVTASLPRIELWCPPRVNGYSASPDGIPLVVDAPLHLDFGGAEIVLKGVTGGNRMAGQPIGGYNDGADKPWLGGWLYVVGNPQFSRVVVENATVEGGYTGPVHSNAPSNVTDKGFRIQDAFVGEVVLRNLELRNFAGEICYLGLTGDTRTLVENCHFHGSPQSAWNPTGTGRVTAINLQAGRAYAPAEIVGGRGHTYIGGRFYDGHNVAVFGGPDPAFDPTKPYNYAIRREDASPPFVDFLGTRFESIASGVALSSFIRGSLVTVDCGVLLSHIGVGHLRDIDLDIEAWADRLGGFAAVALSGPASLSEQVGGAAPGTFYRKSSDIDVRVRCRRTALARASGNQVVTGVRFYEGLFDRQSVRFSVSGEPARAWAINGPPPSGFEIPRIDADVAYASGPNGGSIETFTGDTAYRVAGSSAVVFHGGTGTIDVTMDNAWDYAHGQRFTFHYAGSDPTKVLAFARNGAGMRLSADRTLRRPGEYLTLGYNRDLELWCEVGYLDQAKPADLLPIDATTGVAGFTAAPWQINNLTLTSTGTPGPYGAGDATSCANQGPFDLLYRPAAGRRTLKARVKAGTTPVMTLFIDTAGGRAQAVFDLATGVPVFDGAIDGSIRALGGGWYLVEASGTCIDYLGLGVGGGSGDTILLYDIVLFDG